MTGENKALLATASYIDFFSANGVLIEQGKIRKKITEDRQLTESQIDQFLDTYEVLDQQLERASGFSAMVVRESGKVNLRNIHV
ncbi:hypothetical protein [Avibacterium paragallinarum]|uniref:hypothetical protein n=1 Tax=Avibacterium paragallinarum TaxID=728 RepID=UPI000614A897|nr:hypothetical protein [Avibacterium paragallinarum]QIR11102.1 hypothetical protein HBL79_01880 [Avibacterium paragallinarum]QLD64217.1 hypothetical protein VY92_001990 [Avibacterium paragallinarum]TID29050.1 hypothetical protein JO83_01360 [Avibacterium paragallinarum]